MAIILLMVILAKLNLFYSLMGNTTQGMLLSLTSFVLIVGVWTYVINGNKHHKMAFAIVYSILSFLMVIDAIFFRQFNMYTSASLIKMAGEVAAVGDSVSALVSPIYFLLLIDLPILYGVLIKSKGSKTGPLIKISRLMFVVVMVLSLIPLKSSYALTITGNEFFNLHLRDLYRTTIQKPPVYSKEVLLAPRDLMIDKQDDFYGISNGKNLVVIQVEALQNFVIGREYEGQELTPFLNSLIQDKSIYFDHYYQEVGRGNTSDAEFISLNSIYGSLDGPASILYGQNTFNGLPMILKRNNYETMAFHGFKGAYWNREEAFSSYGFDTFKSMEDLKDGEQMGLGLSDVEVFDQSMEDLKVLKQPFFSFYITLSNHHPFIMEESKKQIRLNKEHEGTLFGNYLNTVRYTDEALKIYFEEMKAAGLYDQTTFVIYGDHHAMPISDAETQTIMTETLGKPYAFYDMTNIPLIIHEPSLEKNQTIHTVGGQVDFLPTILHLFGIDPPTIGIFGNDLFSIKEGFAPMLMYTGVGSFIGEDKILEVHKDGLFQNGKALDQKTKEPIPLESCRSGYDRAMEGFYKSKQILENNWIGRE